MKSAFWRSIAVVALVAVPMMANANDATIGSEVANDALYGGTLMNTTAIFNAFPHLVTSNGTGVELNTMGDGMGKVWWEAYDELWLTMDVGRSDYGLEGAAFMWGAGYSLLEPFEGSDTFTRSNFLNLGIAKPTSGGGAWALGVKLAPFGGTEETVGDVTDEINDTGYGFNGSWGNGNGLHIGAEFAMTTLEFVDAGDPADVLEFSDMGFGVNARFDTSSYIYQGSFVYTTNSISETSLEDIDTNVFGIEVNAGRYLKNEVDGQTSAEFGLAWAAVSEEQADITDDGSLFLFPAVRVPSWEMITDRFGLMGGVGFSHAFASDKLEGGDGTIPEEDKFAGAQFDWSAGLFFQPSDNVRIDARFQEGNLNNVLSLGNQEELVLFLGTTVGLN